MLRWKLSEPKKRAHHSANPDTKSASLQARWASGAIANRGVWGHYTLRAKRSQRENSRVEDSLPGERLACGGVLFPIRNGEKNISAPVRLKLICGEARDSEVAAQVEQIQRAEGSIDHDQI